MWRTVEMQLVPSLCDTIYTLRTSRLITYFMHCAWLLKSKHEVAEVICAILIGQLVKCMKYSRILKRDSLEGGGVLCAPGTKNSPFCSLESPPPPPPLFFCRHLQSHPTPLSLTIPQIALVSYIISVNSMLIDTWNITST